MLNLTSWFLSLRHQTRYQCRALSWMLWREELGTTPSAMTYPGCAPPAFCQHRNPLWRDLQLPGSRTMFFNECDGQVSLEQAPALPALAGGILADEMGKHSGTVRAARLPACQPTSSLLNYTNFMLQ